MNKIALSFDIEDWYHSGPVSGASISRYKTLDDFLEANREQITDCITEETTLLLDILKRFAIRATFFIVADAALRYPEITGLLKNSPHEIASHSLTHQSGIDSRSKKPLKSVAEWQQDQLKAKETLEKIFDREVIGFRAPNAYFANWMVESLQEIGIKYDSSIAYNSLYNKTNVKLNDIPLNPYKLNSTTLGDKNPDSDLVELPWSYYRIDKKIIIPAGGAYFFRLLGYKYFQKAISRALKNGDTMFYLHPLDISRKQIPLTNKRHRPAFWINKGKRTEDKFIKLLTFYKDRISTCKEVYQRFVSYEKATI